MPLSAADCFPGTSDNEVVPSVKNISTCQVQLFLLIGTSRPTSLSYHTGELIPGKMCFRSQPRRRDGVPLFPWPNGISRASATPAVTVLSTSHLSSGPLM